LTREVLRKRDRHRTSTKLRLGVIRRVYELFKLHSLRELMNVRVNWIDPLSPDVGSDLIALEYKLWSSSSCNLLHHPFTSSLLCPNILLKTLFWNVLNLYSSHRVRDQVSHQHKITG